MKDAVSKLNAADIACERGEIEKAVSLYKEVSVDVPTALGSIGMIYHLGKGGVQKDLYAAIEYYHGALSKVESSAVARALISAYCEEGFRKVRRAEFYLEKIAAYEHPVSQLACLWLFALRFRSERSKSEQAEGRAFGEKAARLGNIHARKAMAELYMREGSILRGMLAFLGARLSQFLIQLWDKEDIRLQKC